MTQDKLNSLHNAAWEKIQQYADGLICLHEFTAYIVDVHKEIGDVHGLIDPATGLKMGFPPVPR